MKVLSEPVMSKVQPVARKRRPLGNWSKERTGHRITCVSTKFLGSYLLSELRKMKLTPGWFLFSFMIVMLSVISCDKKGVCEICDQKNLRPIARSGKDTIIVLPTDSILLNGSSSSDPDGHITNYNWSVIPSSISGSVPSIRHNNEEQTIVTNLLPGIYRFELRVTDDQGAHSVDTVTVQLEDQVYPPHPVGFYPWAYPGLPRDSTATGMTVIGPVPEWKFSDFPEDNGGTKWKVQLVQQATNTSNFLPYVEYSHISTTGQSLFYSLGDLVVGSQGENPVGSVYIFANPSQTLGIDLTKPVEVIVYVKF